jgi:hypothetical protein
MSKKPSVAEMRNAAYEISRKYAERLAHAYPSHVEKYIDEYQGELPDVDDFFAWLEGYEFGDDQP